MSRLSAICVGPSIRSVRFWFLLLAASTLAGPLHSAHAAITPQGDVLPSNPPPSQWTNLTTGYIGKTGSGTLTVDGGSGLVSQYGYIGDSSTATGLVCISGSGSTWNSRDSILVGNSGSGTLSITNGGKLLLSVSCTIGIGSASQSKGVAVVDGVGSTFNAAI
jgi:T5SS/PEP-CTERM-associated repeat protein